MIANKKIYCFWFGNAMSVDREKCFNSILANSGVEVILITENNISKYIHPDYPLHPGFFYLCSTKKSDYLKSYCMHIYGGGHSDIKQCDHNWSVYFDELNNSNKLFSGYAEKRPKDIAYTPVAHAYKELVGNGQFIFKPQTSFTKLWYDATQQKMNEIYDRLVANPGHYHPRAIFGGAHEAEGFKESKYPLEWNELMGRIFHKLQYENRGTYLNTLPYINMQNYR
jgi:hypothetical protein